MMTYEDAERILCNQCIHHVYCMIYDEECEPMKRLKQSQWIPVSERLPEDGQTVLIQYVDRKDKEDITMAVGWMDVVLYSWDDRIEGNPDAVAWMPLPPAFVEGDKE